MNRTPLARLFRRFADESGITMIVALGAMTVLSITGGSLIAYATTNAGSAHRSKADTFALALAEAGINNAMSVLSNPANDPMDGTLLSTRTDAYDGGTVTWTGTFDTATATWKLTAVGTVRNPTGPDAAPVQRRVTAEAQVAGPQPLGTLQNPVWNYITATRTGNTCDMTLSASVLSAAPIYTMGNFCLGSGSAVTAGPLEVRGTLNVGTGTVGTVSAPIDRVEVAGGCAGHLCAAADKVFANTITSTPPNLTPPTPDWDYWYANAAPGPKHGCDTYTGTPPAFDNDTLRNKSLTTVASLTPSTSYMCRVGPTGNPTGELSWDATTRILTIRGTIFIDGQVRIDNAQVNRYSGQATLYVSGAFQVTNGSKMCAVVAGLDCDFSANAWDPNQTLFSVVSNGNGGSGVLAGNSIQLGCTDRFQGGLYGTNTVYFSAGAVPAKQQGPIVAANIVLSSATQTFAFKALTSVPIGLPGQSAGGRTVLPPRNFSA